MSQNPSAAAGQVSADGQFRWDGQQWVPIPPGTREPTPWTRPMQVAAAGLFAFEAVYSVVTAIAFINHDAMLKAIRAQGTQIPSGTSVDTVVNIAIGTTIAVIVFFAICELVVAAGSYLGWRWIFWAALILFGLGGLGALTNIPTLFKPETSPIPLPAVLVSELASILSLGMFVWMLIGVIKFGPWAMKKPGA
ncbi:MAG TPA: hypothetical protein VHJ99_08300 [Candidatus Dormibacteraeota bacterium]|nr:hypothetical protein [Candidatus Dormibacteraeota bacterium]